MDIWPLYNQHQDLAAKERKAEQVLVTTTLHKLSSTPIMSLHTVLSPAPTRHQHIDEALKRFVRDQLDHLWDLFHTTDETTSTETLQLAVVCHNQLLATFTEWPLADTDRNWLIGAMTEGIVLKRTYRTRSS